MGPRRQRWGCAESTGQRQVELLQSTDMETHHVLPHEMQHLRNRPVAVLSEEARHMLTLVSNKQVASQRVQAS